MQSEPSGVRLARDVQGVRRAVQYPAHLGPAGLPQSYCSGEAAPGYPLRASQSGECATQPVAVTCPRVPGPMG